MRPIQRQFSRHWSQELHSTIPVPMDEEVREALRWWTQPERFRGSPLALPTPDLQLSTNASLEGWGVFTPGFTASGKWNRSQQQMHINVLELRGMLLGLQAAVALVQGKTVALQGDNTMALAYVRNQGGTHSFQCCQEATQILLWAERHQVTLLPRFVRGETNVHADALSRRDQVLHTEWSMHPQVCERLWILWGRPEVDLFATSLNNKLPLFIAPMPEGPEESVDAFVQDWSNRFLYAYPPTKVIRRVLSKFVSSRESEMILITPMWPN